MTLRLLPAVRVRRRRRSLGHVGAARACSTATAAAGRRPRGPLRLPAQPPAGPLRAHRRLRRRRLRRRPPRRSGRPREPRLRRRRRPRRRSAAHPSRDYPDAVRRVFAALRSAATARSRYGDKMPAYVLRMPALAGAVPGGPLRPHHPRRPRRRAVGHGPRRGSATTRSPLAIDWRRRVEAGRRGRRTSSGRGGTTRCATSSSSADPAPARGAAVRVPRPRLRAGDAARRRPSRPRPGQASAPTRGTPGSPSRCRPGRRSWRTDMRPADLERFEAVAGDAARPSSATSAPRPRPSLGGAGGGGVGPGALAGRRASAPGVVRAPCAAGRLAALDASASTAVTLTQTSAIAVQREELAAAPPPGGKAAARRRPAVAEALAPSASSPTRRAIAAAAAADVARREQQARLVVAEQVADRAPGRCRRPGCR